MMERKTIEEMVGLMKLRRGLVPLRTDCVADREDGADVDSVLREELLDWYACQLRTAPVELLPIEEMGTGAKVTAAGESTLIVELPERAVRVVDVMMSGWSSAVTPVTESTHAARVALQRNRLSRAGRCQPVVVADPGRLTIYGASDESRIESLRCVAVPADDMIVIDRSLFEELRN